METWPPHFEAIIAEHLQFLDGPLTPTTNLYDAGLDSMSTVGLLVTLEDTFDVALPDEVLLPATFESPAALWEVLTRYMSGGELAANENA